MSETLFTTLGIPLVLGRELRATDDAGAPKVVVLNEMFARQYLPGRNPIGLTISEENGADWQIVGVYRDAKYTHIKDKLRPMCIARFDNSRSLRPISFCGPRSRLWP